MFPNITPIILAGGLGTRLKSAVPGRPKVLAPVNGRPFLSYLLDRLQGAGFRRAVLCTGYRGELVEKEFGAIYNDLSLKYSCEQTPLGTGGAMQNALGHVETRTILAMNGDSFINADFAAYISRHAREGLPSSLLLKHVPDTGRYGRVELDKDGCVTQFVEKASAGGPGWINAGVYLFDTSLFEPFSGQETFSLEHDFLPGLTDGRLYGYQTEAQFIDIGTPQSYAHAELFFQRLYKNQQLSGTY